MLLHELRRSKWYKKKAIQRGRWNASGRGNYSTRGLKGQKARTWFSLHAGFEWGQTPLHQRLPKGRWFTRYFKLKKDIVPINVARFEEDERVHDGAKINMEQCITLGYCKDGEILKILGNGSISKKIVISDISISKVAQKKIEKVGWSVENTKE